MLKPRGRKYLFAPAINCQVYLLVDSLTSISLCSFKNPWAQFTCTCIMCALKFIKSYAYRPTYTQFCIAGLREIAHLKNPKCAKTVGGNHCMGELTALLSQTPVAGGMEQLQQYARTKY